MTDTLAISYLFMAITLVLGITMISQAGAFALQEEDESAAAASPPLFKELNKFNFLYQRSEFPSNAYTDAVSMKY